jgi:dTDP-4-amino-4,6-dideoxygalactose transaminase
VSDEPIPFNRPYATGSEVRYVQQAIDNAETAGGGPFGRRCQDWLQRELGVPLALLTHSGTGALELAALVAGIGPGDEVVMPSFTFPSTANAFVLRGATPVFVDVREDTLNLDERLLADAVTPRTRAVVPVHYAGVAAEMDAVLAVARAHDLVVVEDAAHCLPSTYRGRPLGTLGSLGALSFHETKNVACGEGGALLVRDPAWVERAEVLFEKGTDRRRFERGEVQRYRWTDVGSSFAASDLNAAYLWAQLEQVERITRERLALWSAYHEAFAEAEARGELRRPVVPEGCVHNAHLYALRVGSEAGRDALLDHLAARGVHAVFHYVPLHSSPAGRRLGRAHGELAVTDRASATLLRLPLWVGMGPREVERVVDAVSDGLATIRRAAPRR